MTQTKSIFAAVAAGVIGLSGMGLAQTADPLLRAHGPGDFYLEHGRETQVFTYDEPQRVRICVPDVDPVAPGALGAEPAEAVAVEITYDEQTQTVSPGDCVEVQGERIVLSAAEPLRHGTILEGTVETIERDEMRDHDEMSERGKTR